MYLPDGCKNQRKNLGLDGRLRQRRDRRSANASDFVVLVVALQYAQEGKNRVELGPHDGLRARQGTVNPFTNCKKQIADKSLRNSTDPELYLIRMGI